MGNLSVGITISLPSSLLSPVLKLNVYCTMFLSLLVHMFLVPLISYRSIPLLQPKFALLVLISTTPTERSSLFVAVLSTMVLLEFVVLPSCLLIVRLKLSSDSIVTTLESSLKFPPVMLFTPLLANTTLMASSITLSGLFLDRALQWFVSGLQKCHPRRMFLNIPSPSGVRELLDSYSNLFGPFLRNTAASTGSTTITATNSSVVSRFGHLIEIDTIPSLVRGNLQNNFARYGSSLFRLTQKGFMQGSPVAPGACRVVCCYVEDSSAKGLVSNIRHSRLSVSRWVDYIFFKASVARGGKFVRSVDECQAISSELMHRVVAPYQKEFGMKVECPDVFVCFCVRVNLDSSLISRSPCADPDKICLQHGSTAKPARFIRGVLIGQIVGVFDRCLHSCAVSSLMVLFKHVIDVQYFHRLLISVSNAVVRRHPYLYADIKAALSGVSMVINDFVDPHHHVKKASRSNCS